MATKFIQIKDLYLLAVIMLIKVVSLFSSPRPKDLFATLMAHAAYHISRGKRRLAEKNVSDVFGDNLSEPRKREIVKGNFYEFWKEVFSLSVNNADKAGFRGAEIRGLEHLQAALSKGNGVILWESSSFGRRNLAKRILHENGFSINQVHTEHHIGGFSGGRNSRSWVRRHIIKSLFERYETQFVREIIYLPDSDSLTFTRRLLERLKQNGIICITADVAYGQKVIPLKLLGHTKLFATGMVSLASISDAPILPMFCMRGSSGCPNLIIECPINIERNADRESRLEKSIAGYVGLLESYARKYPENYRAWHSLDYMTRTQLQQAHE